MKNILALSIVLLAACTVASADSVCSTHTIRGSWGTTCQGNLSPAENAPLSPIRIIGPVRRLWTACSPAKAR